MNYLLQSLLIASGCIQAVADHVPVEPIDSPSSLSLNNQVDNRSNAKNELTRLSPIVIRLRMEELPAWTTDGESLFYTHTFEDFVEAIAFVNSLVDPAEQLGHHPDITIRYNQVSLALTTHDAQGLTELDFQLARKISQLVSQL